MLSPGPPQITIGLRLTRQRGEGRSRVWGKPLSILARLGEGPSPASRTGDFCLTWPTYRPAPEAPHRPRSRLDVLSRLRRGDILTHCFRPFPNAPVTPDGRVREEALEARRRDVVFDIGHGSGSFGFATAEHMLEAGFLPDAISSDVHTMSIDGPAYDQLVTMGKFLALGLDLAVVIGASSAAPAAALGRADLGRLSVGAVGDASVRELIERWAEYC